MLFKDRHTLWLPKRGNTPEEYEDAADSDANRCRFAIADGASESSYAGAWARLLVHGFVQAGQLECTEWIPPLRQRWLKDLGDGPFPWFTESKIEQGAFATFLGVILKKTKLAGKSAVVWNAVAVGDSCVMHVRNDQCIYKFPLEHCEDFDNSPDLICSRSYADDHLKHALKCNLTDHVCETGDRLWLMTDALAAWFLQQEAGGARPWDELAPLAELSDEEQAIAFAATIERHRESHALRNDDVTLLLIDF